MKLIYLFVALALSAAAFFVAFQFANKEPEGEGVKIVKVPEVVEKPVPTADVYVARQPLPIGTVLEQRMLDRQPWPEHLVLPEFIKAGEGAPKIDGMVTRTPFQVREPIIMSKLANPEDPSFLAASLPKGMRAVTISSDAVSGVAGFIFPGDRVDILINHEIAGKEEIGARRRAQTEKITEVLLSDIRVLAVNQKATSAGAEGPIVPSSFTLAVSQSDAQKLRLAEKTANLSMTLRSLHDREEIELARPTGVGDLSRITPPAYFPVLYKKNDDYTPQVVEIFDEGQEHAPTPVISPLAPAPAEQVGLAPAVDVGGYSDTIIVVRGVNAETVEVERP